MADSRSTESQVVPPHHPPPTPYQMGLEPREKALTLRRHLKGEPDFFLAWPEKKTQWKLTNETMEDNCDSKKEMTGIRELASNRKEKKNKSWGRMMAASWENDDVHHLFARPTSPAAHSSRMSSRWDTDNMILRNERYRGNKKIQTSHECCPVITCNPGVSFGIYYGWYHQLGRHHWKL